MHFGQHQNVGGFYVRKFRVYVTFVTLVARSVFIWHQKYIFFFFFQIVIDTVLFLLNL
jgi:hypothetical protein